MKSIEIKISDSETGDQRIYHFPNASEIVMDSKLGGYVMAMFKVSPTFDPRFKGPELTHIIIDEVEQDGS